MNGEMETLLDLLVFIKWYNYDLEKLSATEARRLTTLSEVAHDQGGMSLAKYLQYELETTIDELKAQAQELNDAIGGVNATPR